MATSLVTDLRWTNNDPKITFDFSYEKKREGSTQYYKVTVSCDPVTGASYFGYPIYLEIKLAGTKAASKTLKNVSPSQWSSALTYTTGWLSVSNKTTGTTALSIHLYSGSGSDRNATYNYSLPIDPAASKIGATDANIESTSTITITKYNSKFTTTVSYKAAGQSSYTAIWTKQTHTSYGWEIPSSLYSLIPNAKEIEIELRCQTYNGSTLIGTETCTLTATTSQSKCEPTVSVAAVDSNANTVELTGSNKKIIKGFSNLKVTTTATAKNSATISSVTVKCGSSKKTGTAVTFSGAEIANAEVTAKDSRGYTKNAMVAITLIDYIKPTIVASAERESPTSDSVKISVSGKWFNGTFGSVTNTLTVDVRYKPKSQSEYTDSDTYKTITVTKSGNTYSGSITISGLSYKKAYDFRIRVRDAIHKHQGAISDPVWRNIGISKGVPVFDWGESDFRFNVPLYSGGVNFTQIYQTADGADNLAQGDSITLENDIGDHRLYYIRPTTSDGVSKANVYIPCTRLGDMIMGIGGYPHSSGRIDIFCVYLTISGKTVTVTYCGYWNTTEQTYAQRKINGIFAVL